MIARASRRIHGAAAAGLAVAFVALTGGGEALAQSPPNAPPSTARPTCVERLGDGATRPKIEASFPEEAQSGHLARLELTIRHGQGETVLPGGFRAPSGSDTQRHLQAAGFGLAEPASGEEVKRTTERDGEGAVTRVSIPFVLLPERAGTLALTLPSLPIAMSRASGESMTVCTEPHTITAIDPVASEPVPLPHANPPPRRQWEDWPAARWIAAGIAIGALLALVFARWLRGALARRALAPKGPPPPPWDIALAELATLAASPALLPDAEPASRAALFAKTSDVVRRYLGDRYGFEALGFDGLETTTDEMLALLRRVDPPVGELPLVAQFLSDCDLVKFARVEPSAEACIEALVRARRIVEGTRPAPTAATTPAKEAT